MEYKEQIKNFLEDKENYSLLISGSWGVGKTHLWKEIELNYIKNPNKQVKNIIYVSLFGKEHYKEVLEEITLKAYKHNKFLYFIRDKIFCNLSVGTFLQLFITKNFENIIVCLDDLERKSDKLDIKDILGLINKLKEEKCKVILISNKDELSNNKEIFDKYKEKCIDLNIHIRSKKEVISQILKEKIPEIPKEIIPYSIYGIKNLRNLNKIIKTLKFLNKELQLTDRLKQNKEYTAFFIEISNKIISNYENIDSHNLNQGKQEFIPLESFLTTINNIIKNYVSNGLIYSIPKREKEEFERELEQYRFYENLSVLRGLLQNSIRCPNSVNKDQFEDCFNSVDEEQLRNFVHNLDYINFIALDRTFHFDKNEKILFRIST